MNKFILSVILSFSLLLPGVANAQAKVISSRNIASGAVELSALSTRGVAGSGIDQMVLGITVEGTGTQQFLISALGPTLKKTGISNALNDPEITLFNLDTGEAIASCDNWQNCLGTDIVEDYLQATGQSIEENEAAMVINLGPGRYTVNIQGSDGGSGITLGATIDLAESDDDGNGGSVAGSMWSGVAEVSGNRNSCVWRDVQLSFKTASTGVMSAILTSSDAPFVICISLSETPFTYVETSGMVTVKLDKNSALGGPGIFEFAKISATEMLSTELYRSPQDPLVVIGRGVSIKRK